MAPLVSGAIALVIGFFTVRLSGMYFAMLTLAFAQLIFSVVSKGLQGDCVGMRGVAR